MSSAEKIYYDQLPVKVTSTVVTGENLRGDIKVNTLVSGITDVICEESRAWVKFWPVKCIRVVLVSQQKKAVCYEQILFDPGTKGEVAWTPFIKPPVMR